MNIIKGIGLVLFGAMLVFAFQGAAPALFGQTGPVHWQQESFLQGLFGGQLRQLTIFNDGRLAQTASSSFSGEITLGNCGSITWNPGSVASSGNSIVGTHSTSTQVSVPGAALGDVCLTSLSSATSSGKYQLGCYLDQAATATVTLVNSNGAAIDFATGTLKVCYFD